MKLVGKRITLRTLAAADAPAAALLLADDEMRRFMNQATAPGVEELAKTYRDGERQTRRREAFWFAIEDQEKPVFLGTLGIRKGVRDEQYNLGYWLGRPSWGKGLMTDAVRIAVHFAFTELGAAKVYALAHVGNEASRRVLEKVGFKLEGLIRWSAKRGDTWVDEWSFSLLRPEWEAHKDWYAPAFVDGRLPPARADRRKR